MNRLFIRWLVFLTAAWSVSCSHENPAVTSPTPISTTRTSIATPTISSVSPTSAAVGSGDVTVTITGSAFQSEHNHIASFAIWQAKDAWEDLLTTFVSSTELRVVIPARLLAQRGSAELIVANGDEMTWSDGGGSAYPKSNAVSFAID